MNPQQAMKVHTTPGLVYPKKFSEFIGHNDRDGTFTSCTTLGTGSFGRVRLVVHEPTGMKMAMKMLKKSAIIRLKQVDHILSEKKILQMIDHPFIVNMTGTFHDPRYLYLVLELVPGGEFFTLLRKNGRFDNETSRFYAAQIAMIFEYLHEKNIIYRDLKPENILVARDGFLKLTDFGFAKIIEYRTYTLCGTPEYIAPEVLLNKGHGKPVDWWTLGILIYEMIVGYPPFVDEDPMGIYQKILSGKIVFPKFFHKDAKVLVKKLLTADLGKRFGNLKNGTKDIFESKWFTSWDKEIGTSWAPLLLNKDPKVFRGGPPHKPEFKGSEGGKEPEVDARYFEDYPDSDESPAAVSAQADPFVDW